MKTTEEIKNLANKWALENADETMENNSALNRGFINGYTKCQQDSSEITSFFEEIWEQMNGRTDEKGDLVYIPQTLRQKIRNYKSLNT
jgi:hypothetical protein